MGSDSRIHQHTAQKRGSAHSFQIGLYMKCWQNYWQPDCIYYNNLIWKKCLKIFWSTLWYIKSSKLSECVAELADMTCWHMMDTVIDFSSQVLRLFELTCLLHFSPFFLDYLELFLLWPGPEPEVYSIPFIFFSAHLLVR